MSNCKECNKPVGKGHKCFPPAVVQIDNPPEVVLFRKVVIPASMGNDATVPAEIGKYRNVLLEYEDGGDVYLYSSDGIPTKLK